MHASGLHGSPVHLGLVALVLAWRAEAPGGFQSGSRSARDAAVPEGAALS